MNKDKFLEAKNLIDKINYLEKWLNDSKRENVKIGLCWAVCYQELTSINGFSWQPTMTTSYITNELPENLKEKVIQLVNDEIESLKEEFNNL